MSDSRDERVMNGGGRNARAQSRVAYDSPVAQIFQGLRAQHPTSRKACVGEALHELAGIFSQIRR